MKLNLPDIPAFTGVGKWLLVGMGGGYDCVGAVPLVVSLGPDAKVVDVYGELGRTGVRPAAEYLQRQVAEGGYDCVIGVDGGVDALMRGDEQDGGTLLEDSVMLAAISTLDVRHKVLACLGFGTEAEEGLCHYRALENIAALAADGGFYGACSLTAQMDCFDRYRAEAERAWEGKRKSHIHTRIIPAVMGQFDDQTMYTGVDARVYESGAAKAFVNPLMGLFWFFDMNKVYARSLLAPALLPTTTNTDALMVYRQQLPSLMKNKRVTARIPL